MMPTMDYRAVRKALQAVRFDKKMSVTELAAIRGRSGLPSAHYPERAIARDNTHDY